MKRTTKVMAVAFALAMLASTFAGMASAVSPADDTAGETIECDRAPWWDTSWHYRKALTIDANGYQRRWGRAIETTINFDIPSGKHLDVNSIRVVYKGTEVPSYYGPINSTGGNLIFVTNESLASGGKLVYEVYFDIDENGAKSIADYGYDWINAAMEGYTDANDVIDEYTFARSNYETKFKITDNEIGRAHV